VKSMSTMIKPKIELGEGRSVDEPLKRLPLFELPTEPIETVGPTLPSTMLLGALRDPRLRLITPLTITFEREDSDIVAYCEELEEFGYGTHLTEAIEDLQAAIAELYFTLKEENDRLGSELARIWDNLQQKIKEVS
jgi:hypothetical protein